MPAWLIVVMILVLALLLLAMRHRAGTRGPNDIVGGDGTRNVGERWRTGGYPY